MRLVSRDHELAGQLRWEINHHAEQLRWKIDQLQREVERLQDQVRDAEDSHIHVKVRVASLENALRAEREAFQARQAQEMGR